MHIVYGRREAAFFLSRAGATLRELTEHQRAAARILHASRKERQKAAKVERF